jgi:hypothetical protein
MMRGTGANHRSTCERDTAFAIAPSRKIVASTHIVSRRVLAQDQRR